MNENKYISTERQRRSVPSLCQICGSTAFYSYFGTISCEACKVFFRRNAIQGQNRLKCTYHGQCEININNRHVCSSCRLEKCFEKGMKVEMIRRSIVNRKSKSKQLGKLPTMNSLKKHKSALDDSQWRLLTNLLHNYQDSDLLLIIQTIKYQNDQLKTINQSTLQNLLRSFYRSVGKSLHSNIDLAYLPSNDRSILLHTAVPNVICLGGQLITYHSQLIPYDIIWKYLEDIYGKITVYYRQLSLKFAQSDIIVWKLSIALLASCTNTRIFSRDIEGEYENIRQILNIQDKYVELTWKYLLYKYDYRQAIRKYVRLIECFLDLTVFMQYAYNVDVYVNDVESLIEQIELGFILDDGDGIVNNNI